MPLSASPTQAQIFTALGDFITDVLGITTRQGQINRVAQPSATPPATGDYCVMWPLRWPRLATNIDASVDAVFTGSITGTTLDITAVDPNPHFTGKIGVSSTIFGVNVATG